MQLEFLIHHERYLTVYPMVIYYVLFFVMAVYHDVAARFFTYAINLVNSLDPTYNLEADQLPTDFDSISRLMDWVLYDIQNHVSISPGTGSMHWYLTLTMSADQLVASNLHRL